MMADVRPGWRWIGPDERSASEVNGRPGEGHRPSLRVCDVGFLYRDGEA